ncbi:Gfo/Idh/MocA family protein [Anaerocolumna sp. MB42-C2]|uniref:Gfo/Idh/MocA family protein n=1 Tax=Anaerocolumna sp. MB42-C2 TaxID=3070997 RepID=UPI0027DFF5FB|nr:Gfo/Idh/MocA family oxidoreductase [Anaerocolumna sp. MB42-C2]WMJ87257.1 Gfo/Idh/MocA family oxidoreductase [Anaerocolumna sp. MB42-C2]
MRKVKIGIIGCGVISNTYIANIKSMFHWLEIEACADILADRAKETAYKYSIPIGCSVEELLQNQKIELVINLTIPAVHTQVNRQILLAGKHVYCEKPLALTLKEAEETLELAKSKGLLVGCAPETFLGAGLQTCRKVLDEGWIGTPVSATANMMSYGYETWHSSPEYYYKKGSGPMLDMGPYYLTALVSLLGPISKTACFHGIGNKTRKIYTDPLRGKVIEVDIPTTYAGIMGFENGVIANINMTFDSWMSSLPKLEIYGTEGTLLVPDPNLFGGKVKIFRKEKVMDSLNLYGGKGQPYSTSYEDLQEIPQVFSQPYEYIRGFGVLDMAFALVNGRRHRTNEELIYHVTEALLSFDEAAESNRVYNMKSTCTRPKPLPAGIELGELD